MLTLERTHWYSIFTIFCRVGAQDLICTAQLAVSLHFHCQNGGCTTTIGNMSTAFYFYKSPYNSNIVCIQDCSFG